MTLTELVAKFTGVAIVQWRILKTSELRPAYRSTMKGMGAGVMAFCSGHDRSNDRVFDLTVQ